jgi:hypothetical protein
MDDQDRARWTKLVADFESSDLAQRECALDRGVSFGNLRDWIYRLCNETRPLVCAQEEHPAFPGPMTESSGSCPRLQGRAVTPRSPHQGAAVRRRDEVGPASTSTCRSTSRKRNRPRLLDCPS